MRGAVLVALAATIGNFLQGWDNATIAGGIVYIKDELDLESTVEGLVVAMSLIGATLITTCSGAISDMVGRRPMLILSSLFYFVSGLVMLWSPNVYVLLVARLIDGFGIGLAVTIVPIYISETAPSEIRGLLNTLPQFTGSGGMFLAYCMVFGLSLQSSPSWRMMLGVLSIPSLLYIALAIFYLPESPRWLVSKGRMLEAKEVLQRLRGIEDVSGEMALLVEGLEVGAETSIEEYVIVPQEELHDDRDNVKFYGPDEALSWVAKPVSGQTATGLVSHNGSMVNQGSVVPFMDPDPLVTLFGSVHEAIPESGSMLLPNFGSIFGAGEPNNPIREEWDEEGQAREDEDERSSEPAAADSDDELLNPLMSRPGSLLQGNDGVGGGWQVAFQYAEKDSEDGRKETGYKRVYLHQEPGPRRGSVVSIGGGNVATGEGDYVVSALVGSTLYSKDRLSMHTAGPASTGPSWSALLDPGVKRALFVGIGLQILQQFSGINGVLYYTPQILEDAGVEVLLEDFGMSCTSASFLISALTTFLMLPCIAVAMRLMDVSGRRFLLLATIPVLIGSLVILVIGQVVSMGTVAKAAISTICVIVYFCCFVMAYGPIPNILCSEIFPTRVRGLCIAICALVFWISDIIVTYTLPVMLTDIGLTGVFSIYAVVCVVSWIFVYLKVPETKGMPLEVISEIFAVGARKMDEAKDE